MDTSDAASDTDPCRRYDHSQNYYPEVLRKMFFVNTNAIFRAFFKCCLPFVDENVRSKIVFVQ
eukprot:52906-Eustigmatos_ZCMA.PRE.1